MPVLTTFAFFTAGCSAFEHAWTADDAAPVMDRKYIRVVALASLFGILGVFILT